MASTVLALLGLAVSLLLPKRPPKTCLKNKSTREKVDSRPQNGRQISADTFRLLTEGIARLETGISVSLAPRWDVMSVLNSTSQKLIPLNIVELKLTPPENI